MPMVLVLARPQAGGVCARNRLQTKIPDGFILNRVIDYTPRMETQTNVFRSNCVMIPDSMVLRDMRSIAAGPLSSELCSCDCHCYRSPSHRPMFLRLQHAEEATVRLAGPNGLGALDSSFQAFSLHPLHKSKNQKIKRMEPQK